jgi:hypothetical protein
VAEITQQTDFNNKYRRFSMQRRALNADIPARGNQEMREMQSAKSPDLVDSAVLSSAMRSPRPIQYNKD